MRKPYRYCVSVVLITSDHRVLLIRKPRKRDTWQLPQGGVEKGETPEHAARRELREETGILLPDSTAFRTPPHVYQYDYPASYVKRVHPKYRGQSIRFLGLKLSHAPAVRVDGWEVIGHAWVPPPALGRYIKRREYLDVVRAVVEEVKKGADF